MAIVLEEDGKRHFTSHLILLIKNQSNDEVISMLKNLQVQDLTDQKGATLLHYAALCGNAVITQHLIDRGCNVDAADELGNTPLSDAVCQGNVDTTEILLQANAKIGKFCDKNFLAYQMMSKEPNDLAIIKSLFTKLTSGCIDNNEIALKLAEYECPLPGVIFLKNPELTKLMLSLGCSVNDRLPLSSETALHVAVELFDTDNIRVLVDHGADMNAKDSNDCTPLHRFRILPSGDSDEKLDILRFLLNRGATLEDASVFTHRILSKGDVRTIRVLMPYIYESPNREYWIFPLHDLAENENDDIVDLLRGKCLDPNALDSCGWKPLDCPILRNFDINGRNVNDFTPLDLAADDRRVRMVQFLLENGADPNAFDSAEETAFTFIMGEPLREPEETRRIVELLLLYGANAQFLRDDEIPLINADTEDKFVLVQPVLAHLAMIESFGESLHKYVCQEIEASRTYKNYFEACKLQIELMKKTIVYESATLYSLLSERKEKIVMFSYNQEFVENYEIFVMNNSKDIDAYYISTIRLRVDETLKLVQMKKKVACIICEIMCLPATMTSTIGYNVVKYLEYEDLEKMLQI